MSTIVNTCHRPFSSRTARTPFTMESTRARRIDVRELPLQAAL
jgi:hypothetical protein